MSGASHTGVIVGTGVGPGLADGAAGGEGEPGSVPRCVPREPAQAPPDPTLSPARLVVAALLPLCALCSPGTRGVATAGCAALVVLLALTRWQRIASGPGAHALLPFTVAAGLWLARASETPTAAMDPLALGLLAAAVFWGTSTVSGDERFTRRVIVGLAALTAVVAFHALYQKLWGLEQLHAAVEADPRFPDRDQALARLASGRAFATFPTPAALGGFLALAVPPTVGLALGLRGRARWLACGAALAGGVGFACAASVTAALAALAALGLAALAHREGRRVLVIGLAVLALGALGIVWWRGERLSDPRQWDSPWRQRAGNARAAVEMAREHPWKGVGPGAFAAHYPGHRDGADNETRHAHNLPLELAAEWGVPAGAGLALLFFGLFVGPLWREREDAGRRGLAIGLAAFAFQNLGDFTAFVPSLLWGAALLRGVLARPAARRRVPSALAALSLAAVVAAAAVGGAAGLARDLREAARAKAFQADREGARVLARRAARLAPWRADVALLLARLEVDGAAGAARDSAAVELALASAERAVRLAPISGAAREVRARARLERGDLPGAYADLVQAVAFEPRRSDYREARDRVGARLGRTGGGR